MIYLLLIPFILGATTRCNGGSEYDGAIAMLIGCVPYCIVWIVDKIGPDPW